MNTSKWYTSLEGSDELAAVSDAEAEAIAGMILGRMAGERPAPARSRLRQSSLVDAFSEWIASEQRGEAGCAWTGWASIDKGLRKPVAPGEFMVIGARTGIGKTNAILGFLRDNLMRDPAHTALMCSMEMSGGQIAGRWAYGILDATPDAAEQRAQMGTIDAATLAAMAPWAERVRIEESTLSVGRLEEAIDEAARHGARPTIVAVDYLGLLKWDGEGGRTPGVYERMSIAAQMLNEAARTLDVVLVVAVQLSREGGGKGESEPELGSFRDSGAIEEAMTRGIVLWHDVDDVTSTTAIRAKVVKNKFGPAGARAALRYDASLRLVEGTPLVWAPERDDEELKSMFG